MRRTRTSAPVILIAPGTQRKGAEFFDYSLTLSAAYPQAILAAGGLPWILPCTLPESRLAECVGLCNGVLLTGGDDVQPDLYHPADLPPELRKTVGPSDPARDWAELNLIRETFRQRKPLLAICRGHQILNVAFGGELIVDIRLELPGALNHGRMDRKDEVAHEVEVVEDSTLFRILRKKVLGVNSTHHQGVREAVPPLRPVAVSGDGVIEAMELGLADRGLLPYLMAVQFHPERLIQRYPEFLGIFRSFTSACVSA